MYKLPRNLYIRKVLLSSCVNFVYCNESRSKQRILPLPGRWEHLFMLLFLPKISVHISRQWDKIRCWSELDVAHCTRNLTASDAISVTWRPYIRIYVYISSLPVPFNPLLMRLFSNFPHLFTSYSALVPSLQLFDDRHIR